MRRRLLPSDLVSLVVAGLAVIERERDAWLVPARNCLGDTLFQLAWESGQTMTREQAVGAAAR
jgi:hypothetical protein